MAAEIVINDRSSSIIHGMDHMYDEFAPYKRTNYLDTSTFLYRAKKIINNEYDSILPQNCRYTKTVGGYKLFVIEEKPQLRTISVDMRFDSVIANLEQTGKLEEYGYEEFLEKAGDPPYKILLSFPYIIYVIILDSCNNLSSMRMFFRMSPLTSMGDYLLKANLLNINSDQRVCTGDIINENYYSNIYDTINEIVERIWLNSFNTDYLYNYEEYEKIPELTNYLVWHYYSVQDPNFIYNCKWINSDFTLNKLIEFFLRDHGTGFGFSHMKDIFFRPEPTHITDEDSNKIFDNITQDLYDSKSGLIISVGDEIYIDDKKYYINSFMGKKNNKPSYVKLEDEEGIIQTHDLSFSDAISDWLINAFEKSKRINKVEVNGNVLEAGNIIKVSEPFQGYVQVDYIRKALDGNIELKTNNEYYFLKKLRFEKVNLDKDLNINGIKMIKGKKYILLSDHYSRNAARPYIEVKYDGFSARYAQIKPKFKRLYEDGSTDTFRLDESDFEDLFEVNDLKTYPVIRGYDGLYTHSRRISSDDEGNDIFYDDPIYIMEGKYTLTKYNRRIQTDTDVLNIFLENSIRNKRLFIPGYDMNIEFRVGDKVVIADWFEPNEMLKVRTIEGFAMDQTGPYFNIMTRDMDGKERIHKYIHRHSGKIAIGSIRRIILKYMGIPAGTKIQANTAGIANFPKKDVNEIIGFINDTGTRTPLILCSNLCTLWAHPDVLKQFNGYAKTHPKWKNLKNSDYDLSKIKNLTGDFFSYYTDDSNGENLRNEIGIYYDGRMQEFYNGSYASGFSMPKREFDDNRIKRYGILNPRQNLKDLQSYSELKVVPNFHGGYIEDEYSDISIKADWRYNI